MRLKQYEYSKCWYCSMVTQHEISPVGATCLRCKRKHVSFKIENQHAGANLAIAIGVSLLCLFGWASASFAGNDWLVRSKGLTVQTLQHDGSITVTRGDPKTDYDQSENRCHSKKQTGCGAVLDLSDWTITAYGTSGYASPSFLTFRNPDDERDIIQVFYDRSTDEIVGIKRYSYSPVDGTRTEQNTTNLEFDAPVYSEVVANW